ncbi:hypothetical protein ES705_11105 [subsurface metagenome]
MAPTRVPAQILTTEPRQFSTGVFRRGELPGPPWLATNCQDLKNSGGKALSASYLFVSFVNQAKITPFCNNSVANVITDLLKHHSYCFDKIPARARELRKNFAVENSPCHLSISGKGGRVKLHPEVGVSFLRIGTN